MPEDFDYSPSLAKGKPREPAEDIAVTETGDQEQRESMWRESLLHRFEEALAASSDLTESPESPQRSPVGRPSPQVPSSTLRQTRTKNEFLTLVLSHRNLYDQQQTFCDAILAKIMTFSQADVGVLLQWDRRCSRYILSAQAGLFPESIARLTAGIRSDEAALQQTSDFSEILTREILPTPGQIWGRLALGRKSTPFSASMIETLSWSVHILGSALMPVMERAERHAEMETQKASYEMAQALLKHVHLEPMLSSASVYLSQALGVAYCHFFHVDGHAQRICGVASSHPQSATLRAMSVARTAPTLVALTVTENQPICIEHAQQDTRVDREWKRLLKSRSLLSFPLRVREQVIGVLVLDEDRHPRQWTSSDIHHITALTDPIALAMDAALRFRSAVSGRERFQTLAIALHQRHEEKCRHAARQMLAISAAPPPSTPPSSPAEDSSQTAVLAAASEKPDRPHTPPQRAIPVQADTHHAALQKIADTLYPLSLDRVGLVAALRTRLDLFSKHTRIKTQLRENQIPKHLPKETELLIYRIVNEALDHIARHARATSIVISIDKADFEWQLTLTDDGVRADLYNEAALPPQKRGGMFWMQEYAELVGGKLYMDAAQGQGTRLSFRFPRRATGSVETPASS